MTSLVPCKSCKKEVAESARTCPHCGAKNPGVSTAKGCLLLVAFSMLMALAISYCTYEKIPTVANGQAHAYHVVMDENLDIAGRTRHRWFITSDAVSFEDRAATVIQAAVDLRHKVYKNEQFIVLRNAKGDLLALADYIPGDKNPWKVQSSTDDSLYLFKDVNITP